MTSDKSKRRSGAPDFPPDMDPGEEELLIAFDLWIHDKHPNPQRKGCPGRDRLMAVVQARVKVEDQYTLDHLSKCAACLDEMKEIKQELAGAVGSDR